MKYYFQIRQFTSIFKLIISKEHFCIFLKQNLRNKMSGVAGINLNELVINESITVQGPPLDQDATERAVTTALES